MRIFTVFWTMLMILCAAPVFATTIIVDDDGPADFNNIQAAIDSAVDGDEVVLADGVYRGAGNRDIDFKGKAITIRSLNGPQQTIIDCEGSVSEQHRGIYFHSGENYSSVLDGVQIINGCIDGKGGAILCIDNSNPLIKNCIFKRNKSKSTGNNYMRIGGAMANISSSPIVFNCWFIENYVPYLGGAVSNESGSYPVFTNCVFLKNFSDWNAGAIYTDSPLSESTLTNCTFIGNRAKIRYNAALFSTIDE